MKHLTIGTYINGLEEEVRELKMENRELRGLLEAHNRELTEGVNAWKAWSGDLIDNLIEKGERGE